MDKRNRKRFIVILFSALIVLLIVGNILLLFGNNEDNKVAKIIGIIFLVVYVIIMIFALLYVGLAFVGLQKLKTADGNGEMSAPFADTTQKGSSSDENAPPPRKTGVKLDIVSVIVALILLIASVAVVIAYFVTSTFGDVSDAFRLFTLIFSPISLILALCLFYFASYYHNQNRK